MSQSQKEKGRDYQYGVAYFVIRIGNEKIDQHKEQQGIAVYVGQLEVASL